MRFNLENKTQEYSRIRFIDRALKKGEKTHYRCIECEQYVVGDLRYTHKCDILPRLKAVGFQ